MKILVIAPVPFFVDRGTPIRILEESNALSEKGHSVDIATYHIGYDEGVLSDGVRISRIPPLLFWYKKTEAGPSWQKIILDFILFVKLCFKVSFGRYDVIHAHLHEGVLLGWLVKRIFFWKKIKLVSDFHGSLFGELESHKFLKFNFMRKTFKVIERFINKLGDRIVVSSDELKEMIEGQRIKRDIKVVLDGVSLEKYTAYHGRKKEIRREMGIPGNRLVFMYSGSFVFNKGIRYIIDFIVENKDSNLLKRCYFIIAGSPISEIKDFYLLKEELEDFVKIISPLDYNDIAKLNSIGDIAIDPKDKSVFQASGKTLEYMAAGLPVVCWNKENNVKYLGEGGFYVEKNFSEEFSAIIEKCLDSREVIDDKSRVVNERIKEFSWKKTAEKLDEIYNKM
ncbi:glycosyltransferase family 4 protein [Patescibacteria group bacterium]